MLGLKFQGIIVLQNQYMYPRQVSGTNTGTFIATATELFISCHIYRNTVKVKHSQELIFMVLKKAHVLENLSWQPNSN